MLFCTDKSDLSKRSEYSKTVVVIYLRLSNAAQNSISLMDHMSQLPNFGWN